MAPLMLAVDFLVVVACLVTFLAIRDYRMRRGIPYPPGPPPLPIIGNLLDIPKEFSWLSYTQLSKKYGDIMSLHVFGQVIVVLQSINATKDLLERRSDIYSDRPVIPIVEMMEWEGFVPFARYTESWRQKRKLLDRGLRTRSIAAYRPVQQTKARVLLNHLLSNPDEWEAHLDQFSGELILVMVYGYDAKGHSDDRMVKVSREIVQFGTRIILPGALLVNDIPFLRYIPEWLSWISYKPLASYGYKLGQEVMHGPMSFARESMVNGTATPSLALENLQEMDELWGLEREEAEKVVTEALASMYGAGTDTTVSSMMSFFLAVLLHPEIQTRAQNEIDAVTGRSRLPTFEDRPQLPFVDAICKEVLRWRPVLPLAMPYVAMEDNVYEGYFIPKGALVIGNTWAILHDPVLYPEPDLFKPERFLNADGSLRDDPVWTTGFGYGKRICPGRFFADTTLFIVAASVLSVFNIEKRKGAGDGIEAYPFRGSALSGPHPFSCSFVPRDKKAEQIIATESLAL